MPELPSGTVTFLFTDIEGSTRLFQQYPEAYRTAVARHHAILRDAIETHGGYVFETVGDAVYAACAHPAAAVAAALRAQAALAAEPWGEVGQIRVRVGIHSGEAERWGDHYFGQPVYRCERLMSSAHGGQVVLSAATAELVRDALPPGAGLRDLGEHRLREIVAPEHVFQLVHPDVQADFPALRSLNSLLGNLPAPPATFVGREREQREIERLLVGSTPSAQRLVTLTGPAGIGKTRLAVQVARKIVDEFPDGVWLVAAGAASGPAAAAMGALRLAGDGGRQPLEVLIDHLRPKQLLLILDQCDDTLEACATMVHRLLQACPHLRILATSRQSLGIGGETAWRVPPLLVLAMLEEGDGTARQPVGQSPAVRLFLDRAADLLHSFSPGDRELLAIAQLCHRLEGNPRAIEETAAQLAERSLEQLVTDLEAPAPADRGYDRLTETEQLLVNRLAVFAGGWTLEAAEAVCAGDCAGATGQTIDAYDVLDLVSDLVRKSLVLVEPDVDGAVRYRLPESLRRYAWKRSVESGEADALQRRLAVYSQVAA